MVSTGLSCGRSIEHSGDSRQVIQIELWTLALSPFFDDYMAEVIADFEAEYDGVTVKWVDVPFTAMNRRLVTAAAAGRSPDVVNLSDKDFARFVALGAMADLNGQLPGDPDEQYLGGVLDVLRMEGQLLGLPWYLTTSVRLCNEVLLAEGGLSTGELASDWRALQEQARAYHAATGKFLLSVQLGEESELPVMMLASGMVPFKEVEEDGAGGGVRLVAELTRPEIVAMVEGWVELYREGVLPRAAATQGHAHLIELYQQGRVAVVQTGANMLPRIKDANPEVYEQTTAIEPITGTLGRSHVALMTVGVVSKTENPKEAAALAWHLTNAANQLALAKRSSVMPSTPESLADELFDVSGAEDEGSRARGIAAAALKEAVAFTPAMSAWPDLRKAFDEGMKPALLDGKPVAEALADIEAAWNRKLRAGLPVRMEVVPRPGAVSVDEEISDMKALSPALSQREREVKQDRGEGTLSPALFQREREVKQDRGEGTLSPALFQREREFEQGRGVGTLSPALSQREREVDRWGVGDE